MFLNYKLGHSYCKKCEIRYFKRLLRCENCHQKLRSKPRYAGIAKRKYIREKIRIG